VTQLAVIRLEAFKVLQNFVYPHKVTEIDFVFLKLKSYYHSPKNRLLECQKFRSCDQKVNENVSDYALELKRLSRTCEFGDSLEDNF
jgi:hypothetical protein